jgi:hypothetical protein
LNSVGGVGWLLFTLLEVPHLVIIRVVHAQKGKCVVPSPCSPDFEVVIFNRNIDFWHYGGQVGETEGNAVALATICTSNSLIPLTIFTNHKPLNACCVPLIVLLVGRNWLKF